MHRRFRGGRAEPGNPARGARWLPACLAVATLGVVLGAVELFLGAAAFAQRLPFTHFSTDDGLAATQVWHVHQDRRGLLWIATTWGLNRYDGLSFTTLSVDDGLPSANTRLTLEDREGNLWIGTNGGLARYDGVRVESYATRGGALAATVWAAGMDRHGGLWFGTDRGLVSIAGEEIRTYGRGQGLADDYAYGIAFAKEGGVWIGSRGHGVSHCVVEGAGRLGPCRVFTSRDGLGQDAVHAIVESGDGALYFGTRGGGLSRFEDGRFRTWTVADGLASDDVYALAVRGDELLIGTDGGWTICALPAMAPCRTIREANGLPDDGVRAFLEDREGVLWIGAEGGLARLVRDDVFSFTESEGLPDGHVYALADDGEGGIWIGTFGGLAHLRIGARGTPTVRVWRQADGLPANWVWGVLVDRRGDLWIATESGIARRRRDGRFDRWSTADGLAGDYVVGLYEDRTGAIWATAIEGVTRLVPAELEGRAGPPAITAFTVADGLASPRSYAAAEDAAGRVWIAHGEGLSWFDGERFHALGAGSGLLWPSTRSLGLGRDGTLWVGGLGQLARLLPGGGDEAPRFAPLATGDALDDRLVLAIAENAAGQLVLGTNHGVLTLDPRGPLAEVVARFDHASGALASEVSHSSAVARDRSGRLWFGFKGGATAFPEREPSPAPAAPPEVVIERVVTSGGRRWSAPFSGERDAGETLRDGEPVALERNERSFRVEARTHSLAGAKTLFYQFRLEGLEEEWSDPRPDPRREYVKLPPGDYRLAARARFGDGQWSAPVWLALELRPAWYETRAATLVAALLGAAAIAAAVHLRTRQVAQRNRQLAREVAARTDDLARYARALEEHVHALDGANERIRVADRHRGEFLAKMSHELRTPLTSVLGFAALLRDGLEDRVEPRFLRYLHNIRESGNHLLRLINNLLDQAKIEAGRMDLHLEAANVEVVVESAVALVEGFAATRDVHLAVRRQGALGPATVDVAKLRQIVINLVSNAIKFAPSGTEVEIAIRPLDGAASPLGRPAYAIAVSDRGPGVDPADHERIFEPFQQLSGRGETIPGTGLGLPIVRQFSALHGGTVRVERREEGGARFVVTLPLDAAHAPAAGLPALPWSGLAPGDRPRVLVLEPDRGRFTALAAELDRRGLLAVRAPDAEEAVRMLRELRPAVVALDIDPARLDAWSALAAIDRAQARGAVPLVLFAFAPGSARGIAAGFAQWFSGPASGAELAAAVVGAAAARSGAGGEVWVAVPAEAAPADLDDELCDRGLGVQRLARVRGLAEAAAGDLAAGVVDLGASEAGGFELVLASQVASRTLPWIALAPVSLPAAERRRLLELAEESPQPAGAAVAEAVERLLAAAVG